MNLLRTFAAKVARAAGLATTPGPRPIEPANLSSTATASKIQAAIRSAEQGDTAQLFTLYRDMMYDNHVQGELQKRKLAVLNQPWSLLPNDAGSAADMAAVEAVDAMISRCANWSDGLGHLLDATVWPLAVAEKVFRPGTSGLRYELAQLAPVNPALLCFMRPDPLPDASVWERDVRIFTVDARFQVLRDQKQATYLDPQRHLVHRGHLMTGQRDFFGGPLRGVLPWMFLRACGRDWFARVMERFGTPFLLGKVNAADAAAVAFLQEQFDTAKKIGGLVVDEATQVELKEIALSGTADAHERFAALCNREISLLIVGQTLSAQAQPTGLGSGTAELQGEVRADLRAWDMLRLGETLREQLFRPFLLINGISGEPPRISWGGDDPAQRTGLADLLVKVNQAGLEPEDESLPVIGEKLGFAIRRRAAPAFGVPTAFSATALPAAYRRDPTDRLVRDHGGALATAYRGAMAPFRAAVLESTSREDCLARLQSLYADWPAQRLAEELDRALQLATAQGAAAIPSGKPVQPAQALGGVKTAPGL